MALLATEGLTVGYDGRELIRDATFSLDAGEFVAIRGPSGSGKSTLLRTLSGLQPALTGEVQLERRSPDAWGWPAFRRRVVLVPQRPVWFGGSVRDELARPFGYASVEAEFDAERASELLAAFAVDTSLDRPVSELSEGQSQRAALARALLIEPSVVLLDEPTSALDEASTARVEERLRVLAGNGLAALLVTHDPDQERRLCSRSLILRDGSLA